MKKTLLIIILFISLKSIGQEIIINTQNNTLNTNNLPLNKNSYFVYFQDKPNTPKYNLEVWDREVKKGNYNTFTIYWLRQNHKKTYHYNINVDQNFRPITEEIRIKNNDKNNVKEERKYFIFENNRVFTHKDTIKHNQDAFSINNTALAFNWELDLETLSMLPLKDFEIFKINFYHPGSKTSAKYYTYKKVRTEKLTFNEKDFDCWILKIDHNDKQWSEFWIDKKTKKVLKMRDYFFGKFRYKVLVL